MSQSTRKNSIFNINIGILGHVDSGKTSLARVLTTCRSTASLDKHPQSQARGITLDLGFSSTILPYASSSEPSIDQLQVTLVDCPGHSSLLRTILGGASIIDLPILVIDSVKGLQSQTYECILIAEMMMMSSSSPTSGAQMIIVLNKIDLLPQQEQSARLSELRAECRHAISKQVFPHLHFLSMSLSSSNAGSADHDPVTHDPLNPNNHAERVLDRISELMHVQLPERNKSEHPSFLIAIDHCFAIKGKGTIVTGTVLLGKVRVNDVVAFPEHGTLEKKVKSLQCFHQARQEACQGDRVGMCMPGLDAKLIERGIAASPASLSPIWALVCHVTKVPAFSSACKSKSKVHITLGHKTVMASIHFFKPQQRCSNDNETKDDQDSRFQLDQDYEHQAALEEGQQWALLCFDQDIICPEDSILIGSRLDLEESGGHTRIAFYSRRIQRMFSNRADRVNELASLRVCKIKERRGALEALKQQRDGLTTIGRGLFKKETDMSPFIGLKILTLTSGQIGTIDQRFGTSGKCRISFANENLIQPGEKIILRFTKQVFQATSSKHRLSQSHGLYDDLLQELAPVMKERAAMNLPVIEKSVVEEKLLLRTGQIERLKGETTPDGRNFGAIVKGLFASEEQVLPFVHAVVETGSGERGVVEKAFGKKGKVRISFPDGTLAQIGDAIQLMTG